MPIQDSLFTVLTTAPSAGHQHQVVDQNFFLILQTPPEGFILRKGKF